MFRVVIKDFGCVFAKMTVGEWFFLKEQVKEQDKF